MARTLILVRHATAIPRGTLDIDREGRSPAVNDDNRWLTEKGRERFLRGARRFARAEGAQVELILTSPLPRAVMTAELLAQVLRISAVEVCDTLRPEGSVAEVQALLQERVRGERGLRVAAVGHEPMLGALLQRLLPAAILQAELPEGQMAKGSFAVLRLQRLGEGPARLRARY